MIARVHPVLTVYTVRGGQRKSKNHVINFPQNVTRFASELPLQPDRVPLIVRREGPDGVNHYDFRVRREKVRAALEWLIQNNKWYRNVVIADAVLEDLPEDGNLQHLWELQDEGLQGIDQPGAANDEIRSSQREGEMGIL